MNGYCGPYLSEFHELSYIATVKEDKPQKLPSRNIPFGASYLITLNFDLFDCFGKRREDESGSADKVSSNWAPSACQPSSYLYHTVVGRTAATT